MLRIGRKKCLKCLFTFLDPPPSWKKCVKCLIYPYYRVIGTLLDNGGNTHSNDVDKANLLNSYFIIEVKVKTKARLSHPAENAN